MPLRFSDYARDEVRLPLVAASDAARARVRAAMEAAGVVKADMAKKKDDGRKIVAENRKARFDYAIEDTVEAGIALTGTEVKSMRGGKSHDRASPMRMPRTARSG